jgi:hypothetical protein
VEDEIDGTVIARRSVTMSAPSIRPSVPRPTVRKSAPPPSAVAQVSEPSSVSSIPPSSPAIEIPKAYAVAPAVIRDRLPTLELADDDLVVEDTPITSRRSTPPPPPPARSSVVPKLEGVAIPKIVPLRPPSMLDPSEALFEGMYDLNYAESIWQAARLCATALGKALGARSVIVHAHDLSTRELRAIGVHGEGEFDLLGSSDGSDDDLVASAVICNEKAVTMRFDGELPRLAPRRLGMIGAPRTLVAVPVMAWGRCIAVIEIIDADERLASRVADSAAYVAERLAEFMSEAAAA